MAESYLARWPARLERELPTSSDEQETHRTLLLHAALRALYPLVAPHAIGWGPAERAYIEAALADRVHFAMLTYYEQRVVAHEIIEAAPNAIGEAQLRAALER